MKNYFFQFERYISVFTAFDFCEWPCACPAPSECQQQWHSWDRSNWSCWGNGGSRCASSHLTLSCERSCGKCCRFALGPFSQCTFWSPLGFADREGPLKYPCQLFATQHIFCRLERYNLLLLCCVMCLSNAIFVPTFVPQTAQEYAKLFGKCLLSIWFFTLYSDLWENPWQMLHVLPFSVVMMYCLKSSGDWIPKRGYKWIVLWFKWVQTLFKLARVNTENSVAALTPAHSCT